MKPARTLILTALLTGCAMSHYRWIHPEGLGEQMRRQHEEMCNRYAEKTAQPYGADVFRQQSRRSITELRGGFQATRPDNRVLGYLQERHRLFSRCMKAQGWRWVPFYPRPPEERFFRESG